MQEESEKEKEKAEHWMAKTKEGVEYEAKRVIDRAVAGKNVLKTILKESDDQDLIIIGASKEGLWKRVRFGTIPERITRLSPVSTLVVRKHEGVILSWIRRFIAG
jgi:nucleotide-binding universal stress UspA family protein